MFDSFNNKLNNAGIVTKIVFKMAFGIKNMYLNIFPAAYRTGKLLMTDKIVFNKISEQLGGNVEMIVCGSAALP